MNEDINAIENETSVTGINPITHPFAEDTPASLYKELKDGEKLLKRAADTYFDCVEDEVRKHSIYENAKNSTLSELFDEESGPGTMVKKRTELQRQAIYRLKHSKERLDWQLAKRDGEAQKQYLESLLGIQTSIEVRAKLISIDERFAGSKYGT